MGYLYLYGVFIIVYLVLYMVFSCMNIWHGVVDIVYVFSTAYLVLYIWNEAFGMGNFVWGVRHDVVGS